ncbi:MAG: Fpg/Nei family DNA glycosylase [Actinomycetales bacterium]|nr:Fpg/Nei family DNA glycosylase [Actinomycetales bacterium]
MPEGDVVHRTARRLHAALAGAPLERAELRWGELDSSPLVGRRTVEVVARGKHLLHRVEGGWTVHTHLRMEGTWQVMATAEVGLRTLANRELRAVLGGAEWTALGLRLGLVELLPTGREHEAVGHLGPDILGADWDDARALANLATTPERPVGEALLDQRNLAGIGTMFAAEALFLEKVNPWTTVGDLGAERLAAVVARARRLLRANLEEAIQSTTGSRRRGEETWVHARSGRECRRCGSLVRVASVGVAPADRVMFYCPTCQGGLGLTDDGRAQAPLGATGRRTRYPR